MGERGSSDAVDRVRRFLDARNGFPIDVLNVAPRTGDRLLASDLRALVDEVDGGDVHMTRNNADERPC